MSEVGIKVDVSDVLALGDEFSRASAVGLGRVVERAEQLVREEAPKVTRNLIQGVSSEVKKVGSLLRGEIVITARTGRTGQRSATLHLGPGFHWHGGELVYESVQITLRAVPAFNYPEAVARGTGVYGPKRTPIVPRKAKALLVPVDGVPTVNGKVEPYIESGGQLFVMRRSLKGRRPNPYDERAAARLNGEAQDIYNRALDDVLGGKK